VTGALDHCLQASSHAQLDGPPLAQGMEAVLRQPKSVQGLLDTRVHEVVHGVAGFAVFLVQLLVREQAVAEQVGVGVLQEIDVQPCAHVEHHDLDLGDPECSSVAGIFRRRVLQEKKTRGECMNANAKAQQQQQQKYINNRLKLQNAIIDIQKQQQAINEIHLKLIQDKLEKLAGDESSDDDD
jgi:hypothetical protein